MESTELFSLWDNVLSMVTEGVDFELLPMAPEPPNHLTNSHVASGPPMPIFTGNCIASDGYGSSSEPATPIEECDFGPTTASGPPPPTFDSRIASDGFSESYDEVDFGEDTANGANSHPPLKSGRVAVDGFEGSPAPESPIDTAPAAALAPPHPVVAPPPAPPPLMAMPKVDPHTEAKQKIYRLIMRLKGVSGPKELKKTTEGCGDAEILTLDYDELDEKGREWADFNARGHKMENGRAFITAANRRRTEIEDQLKKLSERGDEDVFSLKELELATDILDTAGNWFQGGVKELKRTRPLYEQLEKVVESMVEFFKLKGEWTGIPPQYHCEGEPEEVLNKTKAEFEMKHKRWGEVILSRGQAWRAYGFPVCDALLCKVTSYMCGLVAQFVSGSVNGAAKVDTAKDNPKASLAKQRLEESIQLLQTAAPYFTMEPSKECPCELCSGKDSSLQNDNSSESYLTADLLKHTTQVAKSYFDIGIGQFEGFVQKHGKQRICDHFQSILTLLKKVEDLVTKLPREEVDTAPGPRPSRSASGGALTRLPDCEGLKKTMGRSCESLCGHVKREASAYKELPSEEDSDAKQEKTKEMVHWMSFYCKYSYQMSTVSGTPFADHDRTAKTTVQIAFSFIEDNLKQYDSFVHILDRKRIRGHFDRIMKVVTSLTTIATNGDTDSEKLLKRLPNSDVLVDTVIRSCDRLVEHYKNHAENEVSLLQQAVEEKPDSVKKRKEEVTKWLAFGGEYLHGMLNALGPDHTASLMVTFSEFEKVASGVEEVLKNIKS